MLMINNIIMMGKVPGLVVGLIEFSEPSGAMQNCFYVFFPDVAWVAFSHTISSLQQTLPLGSKIQEGRSEAWRCVG